MDQYLAGGGAATFNALPPAAVRSLLAVAPARMMGGDHGVPPPPPQHPHPGTAAAAAAAAGLLSRAAHRLAGFGGLLDARGRAQLAALAGFGVVVGGGSQHQQPPCRPPHHYQVHRRPLFDNYVPFHGFLTVTATSEIFRLFVFFSRFFPLFLQRRSLLIERKRAFLQSCRQSHVSVCLSVCLSVCRSVGRLICLGVLWQNG